MDVYHLLSLNHLLPLSLTLSLTLTSKIDQLINMTGRAQTKTNTNKKIEAY